MLQFLSSLFASSDDRTSGVDDTMIAAATDRVVEGTDRRLRAIGNYRKQLRGAVKIALSQVVNLFEELPTPVEISRRTFSSDPRLHAFFASFEHLQEKVGGTSSLEAYLKQIQLDESGRVYGLLSIQWRKARRMGMVLQEGRILREVQQEYINFLNHNFLGPSISLEEALLNVKKRDFDFMIGIALERIVAERTHRSDLEMQQRLLKRKLSAMKAGNWGLEDMLNPEISGTHDIAALATEIESVEAELASLGSSHKVLDRNMRIIRETLEHPEELLATRTIDMSLDSMNILVPASSPGRVFKLELTEVYSSIGATRILLPGWFPATELPSARAPIADAMHYL